MLINPLKSEANNVEPNLEVNKDKVIGEIISFLINNYSDDLSDIDINRNIISFVRCYVKNWLNGFCVIF